MVNINYGIFLSKNLVPKNRKNVLTIFKGKMLSCLEDGCGYKESPG